SESGRGGRGGVAGGEGAGDAGGQGGAGDRADYAHRHGEGPAVRHPRRRRHRGRRHGDRRDPIERSSKMKVELVFRGYPSRIRFADWERANSLPVGALPKLSKQQRARARKLRIPEDHYAVALKAAEL